MLFSGTAQTKGCIIYYRFLHWQGPTCSSPIFHLVEPISSVSQWKKVMHDAVAPSNWNGNCIYMLLHHFDSPSLHFTSSASCHGDLLPSACYLGLITKDLTPVWILLLSLIAIKRALINDQCIINDSSCRYTPHFKSNGIHYSLQAFFLSLIHDLTHYFVQGVLLWVHHVIQIPCHQYRK